MSTIGVLPLGQPAPIAFGMRGSEALVTGGAQLLHTHAFGGRPAVLAGDDQPWTTVAESCAVGIVALRVRVQVSKGLAHSWTGLARGGPRKALDLAKAPTAHEAIL